MSESSHVGKWIGVASLVIGVSFIVSACFVQRGYVASKDVGQDMASLTGVADKVVKSDKAKWSLQISRPGDGKVETTFKNIQEDEKNLRGLLTNTGIKDPVISVQPASISPGEGSYSSQIIVVETDKVDALSAVAQLAPVELAKHNATVSTNSLEYYYSGMSQLQKELSKQALQDAKSQAKEVLGLSTPHISTLAYSLPVITPENSSYMYGNADTASIMKRISMNVSVTFYLKK